MAEACLAIGAGGTMTWERCAMGLPSIVISIADNQFDICRSMAARGIIDYLGYFDSVTPEALKKSFDALLNNPQRRADMATKGRALVNVQGAKSVAAAMLNNIA